MNVKCLCPYAYRGNKCETHEFLNDENGKVKKMYVDDLMEMKGVLKWQMSVNKALFLGTSRKKIKRNKFDRKYKLISKTFAKKKI